MHGRKNGQRQNQDPKRAVRCPKVSDCRKSGSPEYHPQHRASVPSGSSAPSATNRARQRTTSRSTRKRTSQRRSKAPSETSRQRPQNKPELLPFDRYKRLLIPDRASTKTSR